MNELVIYDLEFTTWPGAQERGWSAPGEYREIVQIAAQAVDLQTLQPARQALNILLVPRINPQLSDFFIELTGIDQEMIDNQGLDFERAEEQFRAYCENAVICSYGCDHAILNENIMLYGLDEICPRYQGLDIRPWFEKITGDPHLPNSGALAQYLGLQTGSNHHAHYALDDVHSILVSARYHILEQGTEHFVSDQSINNQ
jgi:inhibitor of KinA sporulation pathway (predicted exonuclease)